MYAHCAGMLARYHINGMREYQQIYNLGAFGDKDELITF